MQSIPVVDVPSKRVAVDLIGPIDPPSEAGHRYILTLVDYATRYPEAVPLKRIDAETVAEALVDIYSCLGICNVSNNTRAGIVLASPLLQSEAAHVKV